MRAVGRHANSRRAAHPVGHTAGTVPVSHAASGAIPGILTDALGVECGQGRSASSAARRQGGSASSAACRQGGSTSSAARRRARLDRVAASPGCQSASNPALLGDRLDRVAASVSRRAAKQQD